MPDRQAHRAQADPNEQASLAWESEDYADWVVTALFYAALHWLDAYFARTGLHPANRGERLRRLTTDPWLAAIRRHYRWLKDRSEDARYRCRPFTAAEIQQLRRQRYEPVKRYLTPLS